MKNIVQTGISIAVLYLLFSQNLFSMGTASRLAASTTFFWVLWGIELLFMLWWTLDDMRLTHIPMNPAIFIGWLWLFAALGLFMANVRVIALVLVCIAGVPLAIMGVFLLVILIASLFGPIRWN